MFDLMSPADPNLEHNTKRPYSLSNSLFLDPATANKVETLIDQLSNQKTKRRLDIETKFIKLSKYVISFISLYFMLFRKSFMSFLLLCHFYIYVI